VVHKFKSHGHTGHVPRSPSSSDAKPPKKSKLNGTKSSKSAGTRRSNAAAAVTTASVDTVDDESASKSERHIQVKKSSSKTRTAAGGSGTIVTAGVKNEDRTTSGLLIDSIQTRSMQEARDHNRNAFALLKSIDGTPSLVKIFDLPNEKQLLVPATAEDLADAARRPETSGIKSNQVKVAVVATVTQQMDQDGQLVVCIEPTENDADDASSNDTLPQAALAEEQTTVVDDNCELNVQLDEQIQFVRPLPDGGFEIITEEEAASFLEIVENETQAAARADQLTALMEAADDDDEDRDTAQIIISQDEDGQLLVEGTPLQFILGNSVGASRGQQIQLVVNDNATPADDKST